MWIVSRQIDALKEVTDDNLHDHLFKMDRQHNKGFKMLLEVIGKELATEDEDDASFIVTDKKTGKKQIGFLDWRGKDGFIDLVEKKNKEGYVSTGRFIDGKEYEYKAPKHSSGNCAGVMARRPTFSRR